MIMEMLILDLESNNPLLVLFYSHHLSDCTGIARIHVNDVIVMMSKSFVTFPLLVLSINPILLHE